MVTARGARHEADAPHGLDQTLAAVLPSVFRRRYPMDVERAGGADVVAPDPVRDDPVSTRPASRQEQLEQRPPVRVSRSRPAGTWWAPTFIRGRRGRARSAPRR